MTATGADLVVEALRHVGEPYEFGARVPKNAAAWRGPWDCAEFVSWIAYQVAGVLYGVTGTDPATADAYSGRWIDDARRDGVACELGVAAAVAGAVLLRAPADGVGGVGHVALSDGTGRTVEAHSRRLGVTRRPIAGRRWTFGALIPGVEYRTEFPAKPPAPMAPRRVWRLEAPPVADPFVAILQRALVAAGCDPGRVDGVFGARTARAVAKFQRARGLLVDGEVGVETAAALGVAPVAGGR